MKNDSLKINQNKDGSFSVEWDKKDPNWKWLNNMTTKEIEAFINCLLYTSDAADE